MIVFPLLLPGGLLRRGLRGGAGRGGRYKCGKTGRSQGAWLGPLFLSLHMFDHLGEEATEEEVQAQGGGSLKLMQQEGCRGNEGSMAWPSQSTSDETQEPLPGLSYFRPCCWLRQLIWWEENSSWIQKVDRISKCDLK